MISGNTWRTNRKGEKTFHWQAWNKCKWWCKHLLGSSNVKSIYHWLWIFIYFLFFFFFYFLFLPSSLCHTFIRTAAGSKTENTYWPSNMLGQGKMKNA